MPSDRDIEEVNELIAAAVERHVKLEMGTLRRQIRRTGAKISKMLWTGAAVIVVLALLVGVFLEQGRDLANSNRQGIRVSCLLLSEKLFQSGGAVPPKGFKLTAAALAQRRNQEILIGIVARDARPDELRELAANQKIVEAAGGPIIPPDCEDAAKHPARVERELKEAQR